jgi:hypothetical protein
MHAKRLNVQLETMKAIVASNSVKTFYVGVTSRDPYKYWAWYWKNGYKHAVILADWLTERDAKYLEEFLQKCVYDADKRTSMAKGTRESQERSVLFGSKEPKTDGKNTRGLCSLVVIASYQDRPPNSAWCPVAIYIRNTPNLVSGMGALRQAESARDSTRRVSAGAMMPSSHSRAVA